jgi:hypothetical protein
MRILSLIVAFFAATTISAQRLDYLTFRLLNGNEYSLNIASGATITFTNTSLVAQTTEPSLEFSLTDLEALFFTAEPTGINDLETLDASVRYTGGTLHVEAPAGSKVGVYSLDGRTIATLKKNTDGNERFSLPLNKGIYVIRIDQQSFKILAQ